MSDNEGSSAVSAKLPAVDQDAKLETFRLRVHIILVIVSGIGILSGVVSSYWIIITGKSKPDWHPLQIMELFFASAAATMLVVLFRTIEGPIKVKLKLVEFEGSSGPIIMWLLAFLVLCVGMNIIGLSK